MLITSKDNNVIKEIRKLKEKKYRKEKFIVEGIKMLIEAINENASIEIIVINENETEEIKKKLDNIDLSKYRLIEVTDNIFKMLSDVETPQGVLAVVEKNNKYFKHIINSRIMHNEGKLNDSKNKIANNSNENKSKGKSSFNESQIDETADYIIALDGIQDPGNLGTIIRTVDSANLKQIIVSKNTVDSYSPKVIRSTMGAIYRVNVIEVENLAETISDLQSKGFEAVVTSLQGDGSIYDIDYSKKIVVIGNEANGVSDEVMKISKHKVKIPMLGKTESLNASVAAGIMIYEYVRRKYDTTKM